MTAALHLTVTQHSPGRVEVAVFGPLHRRTVAELRRVLRDHRSSQVRIDLANCLDIDLDALRALAIARRIARTHGGPNLRRGSAAGAPRSTPS